MPVSVRRHVLVLLREELNLTQGTFADWIGRSQATVKAIETGKLALSSRLATVISAVTGVDKQWLLRNDLTEPMPPLSPRSGRLRKGEKTYDSTLVLLTSVFERLCHSLRRLKPSVSKNQTIELFEKLLGSVEKPEYKRELVLEEMAPYAVEAAEYLASHPQEFDPELVNLLNADYLVRSVHQQVRRDEVAKHLLTAKKTPTPVRRKVLSRARKSSERFGPHSKR
jgi:DNA-binding XRE family transcriptional regulator